MRELTQLRDGMLETTEWLRDECGQLRVARHALHRRCEALDSDEALDALLAKIGRDRATESAVRLGWDIDDVDVDNIENTTSAG